MLLPVCRLPARSSPVFSVALLYLAIRVEHERNLLSVLDGFRSDAFGGEFDVSHLLIAGLLQRPLDVLLGGQLSQDLRWEPASKGGCQDQGLSCFGHGQRHAFLPVAYQPAADAWDRTSEKPMPKHPVTYCSGI